MGYGLSAETHGSIIKTTAQQKGSNPWRDGLRIVGDPPGPEIGTEVAGKDGHDVDDGMSNGKFATPIALQPLTAKIYNRQWRRAGGQSYHLKRGDCCDETYRRRTARSKFVQDAVSDDMLNESSDSNKKVQKGFHSYSW